MTRPVCTARDGHAACSAISTLDLRWSEQIAPGWSVATRRVYCDEHGWLVVRRLQNSGVNVDVREWGDRPQRFRGAAWHRFVPAWAGETARRVVG